MNIYYVTNKKPLSYNNARKKEKYKQEFQEEFKTLYGHLYPNLPIHQKTLQSNIVYIHHQLKNGCVPDVDNLSKPIVDTFTGVIYDDDRQIIRRAANIIELKDFDFFAVDETNMPIEIFEAFETYYENKEQNIIYFEVGEFSVSQIKIGEM